MIPRIRTKRCQALWHTVVFWDHSYIKKSQSSRFHPTFENASSCSSGRQSLHAFRYTVVVIINPGSAAQGFNKMGPRFKRKSCLQKFRIFESQSNKSQSMDFFPLGRRSPTSEPLHHVVSMSNSKEVAKEASGICSWPPPRSYCFGGANKWE